MSLMFLKIIEKRNIWINLKWLLKVDDIFFLFFLYENFYFNFVMDVKCFFEFKEMVYKFNLCSICYERWLEMKMVFKEMCFRCVKEKIFIKIFFFDNNMDLKFVFFEL